MCESHDVHHKQRVKFKSTHKPWSRVLLDLCVAVFLLCPKLNQDLNTQATLLLQIPNRSEFLPRDLLYLQIFDKKLATCFLV